ncbi:MAG: alternate-type signal peptide domain-containing protein [Microbacteriaceae bacterium]
MNKLVKGSIAGAAGIALLLGGAGTFALWNADLTVASGTVNTGTLDLVVATEGAWDQEIDNIVPGDELTYTASYTVNAVGDNLTAKLSSNIDSIVAAAQVPNVDVESTFTVTDSDANPVSAVAGEYSFVEGTYNIAVSISVTFNDVANGNAGDQDQSIDLSTISIELSQTAI